MPADVANVAFGRPPLGTRGYDEDEVDAFLDVVEAELARLIQENADLRTRVDSLEQQVFAAPVDTGGDRCLAESLGPPSPPPLREQTAPGGDHNVHAARVLGLAQEMADRLTGEAKAEADGMVNHARTKSEQLLSEVRAKAEGMVTDARTRSETMLNEARPKRRLWSGSPGTRLCHWSATPRLSTPRSLLDCAKRRASWRTRSTTCAHSSTGTAPV